MTELTERAIPSKLMATLQDIRAKEAASQSERSSLSTYGVDINRSLRIARRR
jgi:hypothetical protein